MKITKSMLLSALLLGLFSFNTYAGDPIKDKKDSVTEQFSMLLDDLDVTYVDHGDVFKIDFMVNASGEIMVLSTNCAELDSSIKKKLNYKKLIFENIEIFKSYTISLKIEK